MRINSDFLWRPKRPEPPPEVIALPPAPGFRDPLSLDAEIYLEELRDRRYAPKTLKNYRLDLHLAERFMGKHLLDASSSDLGAYLSSLSRQGLKATTIERKLIALKGFYKWANDQDVPLRPDNPTRKLRAPRKEIRHPVHLEPDEIARVMAVLEAKDTPIHRREAAMVKCLYYAGMRASEVVGLNVDDVRGQVIRVIGKGNKERRVPMSPELRKALDLWLEVRPNIPGPLFTSLGPDPGRLCYDRLRGIVNRTIARAGLSRKYTAHKFRHSFGTHLLHKGMALDKIQKLLGHSSVVTTQIYAHTELEPNIAETMGEMLYKINH